MHLKSCGVSLDDDFIPEFVGSTSFASNLPAMTMGLREPAAKLSKASEAIEVSRHCETSLPVIELPMQLKSCGACLDDEFPPELVDSTFIKIN